MPLFGTKKRKDVSSGQELLDNIEHFEVSHVVAATEATLPAYQQQTQLPKLAFHCQLAHGSRTGMICGFTNMKQLYEKISDCLDVDPADVSLMFAVLLPQALLSPGRLLFYGARRFPSELRVK